MEPYRQTAGSSNPRIDIYDDPTHHSFPEPQNIPQIITTPSNDTQLSRSAYGAPGYDAPTAYTHIDPSNQLLPFTHEDPKTLHKNRAPRYQVPHGIRVTWRIMSLLLSITIIGLLGHVLYLRGKSTEANFKYPSGMEIPAWPEGLKLYPTYLFLGAAIVAFVINLLGILLVRNKHFSKLRPLISIPSTFAACALWLGAVVYFKSWDREGDNSEYDLWTWTCSHREFEVRFGNGRIGFASTCVEMTYVYYAGVVIFSVEALNLVAQIWNLLNSRHRGGKSGNKTGGSADTGGWSDNLGGILHKGYLRK